MSMTAPLSAKTTLVGLIGWPVGHSVSPAMHNAAFAALGLDWRYVPLPVDPALPGAVGDAVRGMRAMGMSGINVTVPHKQAVLPFLDRIEPAAQAMRAVNTVIVQPDGSLAGDNTDAPGFVADLRAHGVEPAGRRVLVLGAGGSARAIVYGLAEAGAAQITVANRSAERAAALLADLRPFLGSTRLAVVALPDGVAGAADADLIVNCTSLGMTPRADTTPWPAGLSFRPGQAVYDLVYNPADTLLLRQARADGAHVIGGLGMLIWQGALAFRHWTGQMPPVDVMRAAAEAHLRRHGRLWEALHCSLRRLNYCYGILKCLLYSYSTGGDINGPYDCSASICGIYRHKRRRRHLPAALSRVRDRNAGHDAGHDDGHDVRYCGGLLHRRGNRHVHQ